MITQPRDISPYDFLQALQKEYISLEIRSKIYVHKNDREYFKGLMHKKESAIFAISRKNGLENIIDNGEEYLRVWQEIVPKFGFPKFVYNVINVSKGQLEFPYTGSVVEILKENKFAMSLKIDERDYISVIFPDGTEGKFLRKNVVRLNHKRTDEYFYYYPNNYFHCDELGTGILKSYDMNKKVAEVTFNTGKEIVSLQAEKISRIL